VSAEILKRDRVANKDEKSLLGFRSSYLLPLAEAGMALLPLASGRSQVATH
jgi:hypothetical protein